MRAKGKCVMDGANDNEVDDDEDDNHDDDDDEDYEDDDNDGYDEYFVVFFFWDCVRKSIKNTAAYPGGTPAPQPRGHSHSATADSARRPYSGLSTPMRRDDQRRNIT